MYEAAGVKRGSSRFSLQWTVKLEAGTRGTNIALFTKGSDSVV